MFKTEIAKEIWSSKYKFGDETPIETFERVARALASVEKEPEIWYERFLNTLVRFHDDVPVGLKTTTGGRITANVGTTYKKATLLNCFVSAPVSNAMISYQRQTENGFLKFPISYKTDNTPDDLINIFLTIVEQAKTLASEGGYGLCFDFIRPRSSIIKGTGIKHPGVVAYMKIWDSVSQCIVQGDADGYVDRIKNYLTEQEFNEVKEIIKKSIRKGAMLGSLSCFSKDTIILTNLGWLSIIDIIKRVEQGEIINAIDENGNENLIYDPIKREPEKVFVIETVDGEKLEVTKDHKFEVINTKTGDVYLKALKDIDIDFEEVKIINE
jgi:ribonucleotide reductase alpha subunit